MVSDTFVVVVEIVVCAPDFSTNFKSSIQYLTALLDVLLIMNTVMLTEPGSMLAMGMLKLTQVFAANVVGSPLAKVTPVWLLTDIFAGGGFPSVVNSIKRIDSTSEVITGVFGKVVEA